MKLKSEFVTHEADGEQIMVTAGAGFSGMVRSNRAAAFIVDCLKAETSLDAIVDAMEAQFDAPRAVLEADAKKIVTQLRGIGALDD